LRVRYGKADVNVTAERWDDAGKLLLQHSIGTSTDKFHDYKNKEDRVSTAPYKMENYLYRLLLSQAFLERRCTALHRWGHSRAKKNDQAGNA
jgi:hypothetical protein